MSSSVWAAFYPLSHRLKLTLGVSDAQNALLEEKRCLLSQHFPVVEQKDKRFAKNGSLDTVILTEILVNVLLSFAKYSLGCKL